MYMANINSARQLNDNKARQRAAMDNIIGHSKTRQLNPNKHAYNTKQIIANLDNLFRSKTVKAFEHQHKTKQSNLKERI